MISDFRESDPAVIRSSHVGRHWTASPLESVASVLLPLAFLWFILINQLRFEWTVNPQYAYGWAVPVLCVYLGWQRVRRSKFGVRSSEFDVRAVRTPMLYTGFALCALLLAPTRLIQEANPEWRLVSWALALEVIGLTLLLVRSYPLPLCAQPVPDLWSLRHLAFPICFFLVAVPWPTIVEGPVIQRLTQFNSTATVQALTALGIPALQLGNVIEVSTGQVGIEEACSGIRSFQASLMIALFLGELYRLTVYRRTVLVFAGFAFAILGNLIRTCLLVWVAARHGLPAITAWHDPTGITILLACFVGLWGAALWAKSKEQGAKRREQGAQSMELGAGVGRCHRLTDPPTLRPPSSVLRPFSLPLALGLWLILVEAGVELWYRAHEWDLAPSIAWRPEFPRDSAGFQEQPLGGKVKQFLRHDEGMNASWTEGRTHWQMIFLRWNPGRIAVHLAKSHTPAVCLSAAGKRVLSESGLKQFRVGELTMPFRSYVVDEDGHLFHVFYCLWEDRAAEQSFATTRLNYGNRLAPVLAGRRLLGQRSLEIAVSGFADAQQAEAEVIRELRKVVKVGR